MTIFPAVKVTSDQNAQPQQGTLELSPQLRNAIALIHSDESTIKGILWGIGALKLGTATLAIGATTLVSAPLITTPAFLIPPMLALGTYITGSLTGACLNNALYHLGSRNIIVLFPAN